MTKLRYQEDSVEQDTLLSPTEKDQKIVKHLKLHSLTMTKPEITFRNKNYRTSQGDNGVGHYDDDDDEEMTQMSCGMNLRSLRHTTNGS